MTNYGLIGCYDILGYKNINDNNEIQNIAKIINEKLLEIPNKVKKILLDHFDEADNDTKKSFSGHQERIKFYFISDTIIIALPIIGTITSNKNKATYHDWYSFLGHIAMCERVVFDLGFPMRGAVDIGEYYISSNTEHRKKKRERRKGDRFIFFILPHRGILLKLFFMSTIPINKSVPFSSFFVHPKILC